MKQTNICIKCDNQEIALIKGSKWEQNKVLPVDWRMNLPLDRFICLNCGYTEEYVNIESLSPNQIERLAGFENPDYLSDSEDEFV